MKRLEYRGCVVRFQFTGAGWFMHWRELTTLGHAKEGCVTAPPEETLDAVLDLARKEINRAITEKSDCC